MESPEQESRRVGGRPGTGRAPYGRIGNAPAKAPSVKAAP
ncbi:hypothetical protein DA2_2148 [Desulfovibrio sp. A2]|nr:hypothetical protein DA2_2148 [Desulfovibrio sp. A2]